MTAIDSALTSVNSYMGQVGGLQNQLQYTINNLSTSIQNYTSSESTIEDVDMASEVSNLTKNQILQQSAMAMLAQANSEPQQVPAAPVMPHIHLRFEGGPVGPPFWSLAI